MNERVNYPQFRNRFLENSQANHFSLINIQLKNDLFIDLAYKEFDPNFDWVIHISGTHGIEGYLGSDIQSQALVNFPFHTFDKNILFIHALNPYGMKHFRRMNFANIDLNRNSLSDQERSRLKQETVFQKYIEWNHSKNFPTFLFKTARLLWQVKQHQNGWDKASREVVQGQLIDKNSLFFCGEKPAEEIQLVQFHIQNIITSDKKISVIDIHTGLGEYMKESLIVEYFDHNEFSFWKNNFINSQIIIPEETKGYYKVNGGLSHSFRKLSPYKNINYIYQEFGTKPNFDVIHALIKENLSFQSMDSKTNNIYENPFSHEMLDCFYPSNQDWQSFGLEKGLLRLKQALLSD